MSLSFPVDISAVLGESGSILELEDDVPLESLVVSDSRIIFPRAPHVRATVVNLGDVLLLSGAVETVARLECSRCLEPFDLTLEGTLDAVISITDDPEARNEDQEWYPLQGERFDLLPAVESALRVEIPFAPVHDESCRGICPTCGCDLNRDSCECEQPAEHHREGPFASLKELLPPEGE